MRYLVAYDVANSKRLAKVAKTLEGYGTRVLYSVFECDLTPQEYMRLKRRIQNAIKEDDDAVLFIRLCGKCGDSVRIKGQGAFVSQPAPFRVL